MRTESEIKRYLQKKETPDSAIDYTLAKLKEYGYINDQQFAIDFASAKAPTLSFRRIQGKLRLLGVDAETARQATGNLSEDTEYKAALTVAQKALKSLSRSENVRNKLTGRLLYRGFGYDVIRRVVSELLLQEAEQNPEPEINYECAHEIEE